MWAQHGPAGTYAGRSLTLLVDGFDNMKQSIVVLVAIYISVPPQRAHGEHWSMPFTSKT